MNIPKTGRALQLEGLQFAQNKVTLGFKCDAGTKIQLAQEAQRMEMTLSEYVDTIIASRHLLVQQSTDNESTLTSQLILLDDEVGELKARVAFYENEYMQEMFRKSQGTIQELTDSEGNSFHLTVNSIQDVYTVLLNHVQTA